MRDKIFYILLCVLSYNSIYSQDGNSPLTLHDINQQITDSLDLQQEALNWSDMSTDLLWSTLIRIDSVAIIGFMPISISDTREAINSRDFSTPDWNKARNDLMNFIRTENRKTGTFLTDEQLFDMNTGQNRPYLYAKIFSKELIESLRGTENIRYVEPANYEYLASQNRSGEGCSDYSVPLDTNDYVAITPTSISSWTQSEHMIDSAWTKSNKGEGVWIAVMDTGVSATNPKFNGEFDEGDSSGRVIEKKEFYNPNGSGTDGWQDQCGHGTAMAGLATGTRGFDSTPAGVSYKSNLISYRVTNDVIINVGAEIDGLRDALYDAADDSRVSIISISLGDIFSHGPVEDGIIYAHDNDKLIFAAAGTSTSFTNFFGVIAPANMPEAIAVTGVIEGSDFQRCNNCHSGNEVQFCVFMERSATGNNAVTNTNDNASNNDYRGYVGGSSSSTAIMAGIAGLVFSNNLTFSRDQVLNRLIQTSSRYPIKDSQYGWGTIDACQAVDTTLSLPCSSVIGNSVTMEINTISFPPVSDGNGDPELILKIGGQSYYFNVPSSGATSNPNTYIDPTICDNVPIIVDLGQTACSVGTVDIVVETHEDDGIFSECNFDAVDDFQVITTETIDFDSTTFTQSTPNGDWVFTYSLSCAPTLVAGLSTNLPLCSGEDLTLDATPSGETNYDFFLDSNSNGLLDSGESLQSGTSETFTSNTFVQDDIIGIEVTDINGCTSLSFVTVQFVNFVGVNALEGVETGIADYETNDTIQSTQTIEATAIVDYDAVEQICLDAGFEVVQGAIFTAFLDGCNDGLGGENIDSSQDEEEK